MRILQVNTAFVPGGTARVVNSITLELISVGDECLIVASRGQMASMEHSMRIGGRLTTYWNALMARCFDNDGFVSKSTTRKLISIICSYSPDIIHLHNLHGYYINIRMLFDFLKTAGIPVVWTLHDCWAFTGHCSYFTNAKCSKWKDGSCDRSCELKRDYPACYLLGRQAKNLRLKREIFLGVNNLTIVTPSRWLAACVSESFLKEYPINIVYNGVDTNVFKPVRNTIRKQFKIGNKTLLLGVAMQWTRRKNLNSFIELARKLSNKYVIMLVGVNELWRKELPKNIICVPAIVRPALMAQFYSAADILLNLSTSETFGLVSVEALACGTPVIIYNNTASPEIIDESCGYIVNESDGIDAVADIVRSKTWRGISAKSCIARASKFTVERQLEQYRNLYQSRLKEN